MTPKLKARLYLLFIFFVCAAPVALSLFTYYVWKPEKRMNYGELLQTTPVAEGAVTRSTTNNPYLGKWVLLLVDGPECPAACEKQLYSMRQTAIAMEMKKEKLAQVWVIAPPGPPKAELIAQYPDTNLLVHDLAWLPKLPEPAVGRIFLLDPKGVPLLRYPADPDAKGMMKDLGRLLDIKRM